MHRMACYGGHQIILVNPDLRYADTHISEVHRAMAGWLSRQPGLRNLWPCFSYMQHARERKTPLITYPLHKLH